jgi:hypothetical protein
MNANRVVVQAVLCSLLLLSPWAISVSAFDPATKGDRIVTDTTLFPEVFVKQLVGILEASERGALPAAAADHKISLVVPGAQAPSMTAVETRYGKADTVRDGREPFPSEPQEPAKMRAAKTYRYDRFWLVVPKHGQDAGRVVMVNIEPR